MWLLFEHGLFVFMLLGHRGQESRGESRYSKKQELRKGQSSRLTLAFSSCNIMVYEDLIKKHNTKQTGQMTS